MKWETAAGGALILVGIGVLLRRMWSAPDVTTPQQGVCKEAPPTPQPPVPAGWRQYSGSVSSTATTAAVHALSLPWGTWSTFVDDDGAELGILRMWHCHEPDSGMHPVGWHQGATLYRQA